MGDDVSKMLFFCILLCSAVHAETPYIGTIQRDTPAGLITMSTRSDAANAICSLTLGGMEMIDHRDHGRCLQSALSIQNQPWPWNDQLVESYNPTEAGSVMDGLLPGPGGAKAMNAIYGPTVMATETCMAPWKPVAGLPECRYVHRKYIAIGTPIGAQVIEYRVSFQLPPDETRTYAQFEVLTGYMPVAFSEFKAMNPRTGVLGKITDGPGEQDWPIVFSTPDGRYAMGVWSPVIGGAFQNGGKPGFGRFRFRDTVKWNVVQRLINPRGTYSFRVNIVVGSVAEVTQGLGAVVRSAT